MRGRLGEAVRAVAVVTSVALTFYWALFALDSFPWIVPADHNSDYVKAYANAARAGLIMSVVSIAGTVIATGALARTCLGWCLSAFLLGCMIAASIALYPPIEGMRFLPFRLPAQVVGAAAIVLGTVGFQLPSHKKED